ncbi:22351_t:CDS:1, partial [Dentiscutata erythropus]
MESLKTETVIALNNFLKIWKQDPVSQKHLDISPQNIYLWNEEEPENVVNLNPFINTIVEINFDEFLQIETEVLLTTEETTSAEVTTEFKNHPSINDLTLLVNDLKQTPVLTTRTITNSFSGGTWKDQVDRILKFLLSPGQTRVSLNKKIEAYYYLGLLISKSNDPLEIKTFIQKAQSERKARNTWKGALRSYELLTLRPKKIIFQLRYTTATCIIKLPDQDYTQL